MSRAPGCDVHVECIWGLEPSLWTHREVDLGVEASPGVQSLCLSSNCGIFFDIGDMEIGNGNIHWTKGVGIDSFSSKNPVLEMRNESSTTPQRRSMMSLSTLHFFEVMSRSAEDSLLQGRR